MPKPWTVESSRVIHEGRPHRLRLDTCRTPAGGRVTDYFVREVADVAMVVAVTPADEIVLVRQYRHGAQVVTLEVPQGLFETGEDALAAGARELREETGFVATLERVGTLLSHPAIQASRVHVLLGRDARGGAERALDPEEEIEVVLCPLGRIEALVASGEADAATSVAGLLLVLARLGKENA